MSVFICRENRLENARIFAQGARGEFAGTRVTLVRRTAGRYLEKADRGEVRSFQQRLVFTETQTAIIQKKMMERAAELSRGF